MVEYRWTAEKNFPLQEWLDVFISFPAELSDLSLCSLKIKKIIKSDQFNGASSSVEYSGPGAQKQEGAVNQGQDLVAMHILQLNTQNSHKPVILWKTKTIALYNNTN